LRSYYLEPDLVPDEYRSEGLAAALKERVKGQRVLLARADRGRETLREQLALVAEVDQVTVYSQVDVPGADLGEVLREGPIDYVTLTSSNIARALLGQLDAATQALIRNGSIRLVSISSVTTAAVAELSLPVAAEATEATMEGVVTALIALAQDTADGQGRKRKV
jgi:uroporphyrinogen III methyltransferase/synthase